MTGEQRYKALVAVAVGGESVKAGATFTATAEQVAEAVAAGLVESAPAPKGKAKA